MSDEEYNELKKQVNKANRYIANIQRKYGENSWAINKLYDKIDNNLINGVNLLTGGIRLNKSMSKGALNTIRNATKDFLASKTSTIGGIEQVRNSVIKSLRKHYNDENINITRKDAEKLYSIVEDKDLRDTVEKIGASELWGLGINAKQKNMSEKQFLDSVKKHIDFENDVGIKEDLLKIYRLIK